MSGLFLSTSDFSRLSEAARAEILALLSQGSTEVRTFAPPIASSIGLDISFVQARKIIADPLSEKTRKVLRAIAEIGPRFGYRQLAQKVGVGSIDDLGGVWAGITRRTRSVVGDRTVDLIIWDPESAEWVGEKFLDQQASVTQRTYQSLREAFNLA